MNTLLNLTSNDSKSDSCRRGRPHDRSFQDLPSAYGLLGACRIWMNLSLVMITITAVFLPASVWAFQGPDAEPTREASDALPTAHVFYADQLWTGEADVIQGAALVVRGGKIEFVGTGTDLELPAGAVEHRLGSVTLIPGLVVAETTLAEFGADDDLAITPEIRAVDGFDFFAPRSQLLAGGITTVQLSPGSRRLLPGQGSVVKVAGDELKDRVLRDAESLRVLLTSAAFSPPTVYEPPVGAVSEDRPLMPTNPQLAGSLSGAVSGLRALLGAAVKMNDPAAAAFAEMPVATLATAISEKQTFRFTAKTPAEVRAARRLVEQFQLNAIFVQPDSADSLAEMDWNDARNAGVILSPGMRPGEVTSVPVDESEQPQAFWEIAKALFAAGAKDKIALRPDNDSDLSDLMFLAGMMAQGDLDPRWVLQTITSNPARILGVSDRVGRLQVGCDADFVVLSGTPFAAGTRVLETFINGKSCYHRPRTSATQVIRANAIYSADGIIPGGSIAVADGKIRGLGTDVSSDLESPIQVFDGVIVPGFIDAATGLGLGASVGERLGLDVKLGEFLMPEDESVQAARRGGITTAFLSSTNLPSPVVAFKLSDQPRVIKDPVAIRFEVKGNLTATEESLRRTLAGGKAYDDAWKKYEAEMEVYREKKKEYGAAKAKYDAAVKAAQAKKAAEKAAAEKKAAEEKAAAEKKTGKSDGDKPAGDGPAGDGPEDEKKDGEKPAGGKGDAEKGKGNESETDKSNPETSASEKTAAAGKSGEAKADDKKEAELQAPEAPKEPTAPKTQAGLEPYRLLLKNEIVAIVETDDAPGIRLALKLFCTEFKLSTLISGNDGLEITGEEIAAAGAGFVAGPRMISSFDGQAINYPQRLANLQIPFALQSKATTGSATLPLALSYAVHQGLGRSDALAALTDGGAKALKLEGLGQLKEGGDADLVVLSGKPFEASTYVIAVMIDGQWVYKKESNQ